MAENETHTSERAARVIAVIAVLVALAASVLAVFALNRKTTSANAAPVHSLQAEVAVLRALRGEVAQLHGLIDKADATIAKFKTCIPELSALMSGLTVETAEQNGWLTGAYLNQHKQISSYCTSVLEVRSGGAVGE